LAGLHLLLSLLSRAVGGLLRLTLRLLELLEGVHSNALKILHLLLCLAVK